MPFCKAPFTSIYYHGWNRKIAFCCEQDRTSLNDSTIEQWWNSDSANQIRNQFNKGEWPDSCHRCRWQEEHGMTSLRSTFDNLTVTNRPVYIDYRPDNLCNLQCTMCGPDSSNLIEKLWKQFPDVFGVYADDTVESFADDTDAQIKQIINTDTQMLKILGGEPTVNKKVHDVFKYCIDKGYSKHIDLKMTTNFTNLNSTYSLIEQFKSVRIVASIDATGPTYEYIRQPARWHSVRNHLINFSERYKNNNKFKLALNCVWQPVSAFTVAEWFPELAELFYKTLEINRSQINIIPVGGGVGWAGIPVEYRTQIIQALDSIQTEHADLINSMKAITVNYASYSDSAYTEFVEQIKTMDRYKGTDITALHPLWKQLISL